MLADWTARTFSPWRTVTGTWWGNLLESSFWRREADSAVRTQAMKCVGFWSSESLPSSLEEGDALPWPLVPFGIPFLDGDFAGLFSTELASRPKSMAEPRVPTGSCQFHAHSWVFARSIPHPKMVKVVAGESSTTLFLAGAIFND